MTSPHRTAWTTGVIGLLASLVGAPVAAQAPSADTVDTAPTLPTVDVIGQTPLPGGLPTSPGQFPAHVQQADDGAIARAGSANLVDFMQRQLAGVNLNEIQGSPFQVDLTYRGQRLSPLLGSSQGLSVYLDGARFNEPLGDVMHWEALPEAAIATLTLVPGSNPLYGLNTLGGALVLTTKSGLSHPGTEMDTSLGRFGRRRLDLGHGRQWADGWHGYGAATLFDEDGWRERSPGRLDNLFLKLGREVSDLAWTVSYTRANSRLTGNGLLSDSLARRDPRAGYTFEDTTDSASDFLNFQFQRTLTPQDQLALSAWHRRIRRTQRNGDVNEAWSDWLAACADQPTVAACNDPSDPGYVTRTAILHRTASRQTGTGAGVQWSRHTPSQRLAVGAEVSTSRVDYDQFAQAGGFDPQRLALPDPAAAEQQDVALRGRSRTWSLLATDLVTLSPRTHLTLSARWNQTQLHNDLGTPAPLAGESFHYRKLNPALGLTHAPNERLNVFASYAQGTRVPTAIELGCADPARPCTLPTGLQSDPYLRQVVARTLELGVRARPTPALQLSSALFRTASADDIVFVRSGTAQAGYFTNVGKTLRRGLELSARWRSAAWQWRAQYTVLRATYESDGILHGPLSTAAQPNRIVPGTPLAGLPRHWLTLSADARPTPTLQLGGDLLLVGSQVVAGNESGSRPELGRLAGHALLNARASWQWTPRWQAYLRIHNLLDRRYASYAMGNLDLFPGGQSLAAGEAPAASRFVAPGAPRALWVGARYAWDR